MILQSAVLLGALGGVIGLGLTLSLRHLKVDEDERVELLTHMLPGVNCGACGLAGCADMAEALATGTKSPGNCPIAGSAALDQISHLLGVSVGDTARQVAQLVCQGTSEAARMRADYVGLQDCWGAQSVVAGPKGCTFGCLGFGSCIGSCPVGAISLGSEGIISIDAELCTGCGLCVPACPRRAIALFDREPKAMVRCASTATGRTVRSYCSAGCIQCRICIRACPLEAIDFKDGHIVIDRKLCDACGICVEKCPTNVIDILLSDLPSKARNGVMVS